jgi:hypothetical protein
VSVDKVKKFLTENPKFVEILKKAVEHEENHAKDAHYLGWEWSDVRAYPAELMKLVREGIVDIKYKSKRSTYYILANKEAVKKYLESSR